MSFKLLNSLLIFLLIIKTASFCCYCTIKLCPNRTHTLCKYKNISDNCKEYKKITLTDHLKQYIVDIHNEIRNHVASGLETKGAISNLPPAANMALLQWDEELELIAQRWADQCPQMDNLKHDECKTVERFDVGQNMVLGSTNSNIDTDFVLFILSWYKQVQNMISLDVDQFIGMNRGRNVIGLYTQLIWAKTLYVGCGISMYKDSDKPNMYLKFFVCNYGPRGNVVGESVYLKGAPCSKCPKGCTEDYRFRNLCKNEGIGAEARHLDTTIRQYETINEDNKNQNSITTSSETPNLTPIGRLLLNNYNLTQSDKNWVKINDLTKSYKNEPVAGENINSFAVHLIDSQFERLIVPNLRYYNEDLIIYGDNLKFKRRMGFWLNKHCRFGHLPEKPLTLDDYLVIDEVWLKNNNKFIRRDPPGKDNEMCMCLIQWEN